MTALNNIIPHDPTKAYDIKEIITKVRHGAGKGLTAHGVRILTRRRRRRGIGVIRRLRTTTAFSRSCPTMPRTSSSALAA